MTNYCVGCDNIVGGEKNIINRVAKVLEEKGHSCEKLNVGPNYTQSKGLQSSSKGKVAVFIVGGSDIGTYVDFRDGIKKGYYHYKYIWFAFASWTASTWITCKELKSRALVRAHDDNFSSGGSIAPYIGKSADYFFSKNKDVMGYVCGQTPEELANKILGGGSDSGDDGGKGSSGGSIKESLQKLLTHWDGQVECYIRGDTVCINKIRDPDSFHMGILQEGVNVFYDSVTLTDINSNTPNILEVEWTGGTITFRDEELIKRFGEIKSQMTAVRKEVVTTTVEKEVTTDSGDSDEEGDEDTESTTETTTETKTTVEEIPIDNYDEALEFAHLEWNKLKRDNGRQLELQTLGASNWKSGDWVKVVLPTFSINNYMYIIRTSQSLDNGDWTCNMTLVDYPPGWGKEVIEESSDEEEEEDEESSDEESDE